jgi:hypothetical protein
MKGSERAHGQELEHEPPEAELPDRGGQQRGERRQDG